MESTFSWVRLDIAILLKAFAICNSRPKMALWAANSSVSASLKTPSDSFFPSILQPRSAITSDALIFQPQAPSALAGICRRVAAAECLTKAADSNDADSGNCFGGCLERGDGANPDLGRAVWHYGRAASLGDPDALYNFGHCVEYGKGIG
jgi:TPR repeat protein